MNPGQLPNQGQVKDPEVNFALVYGLTSVTVHMSFSLARLQLKGKFGGLSRVQEFEVLSFPDVSTHIEAK